MANPSPVSINFSFSINVWPPFDPRRQYPPPQPPGGGGSSQTPETPVDDIPPPETRVPPPPPPPPPPPSALGPPLYKPPSPQPQTPLNKLILNKALDVLKHSDFNHTGEAVVSIGSDRFVLTAVSSKPTDNILCRFCVKQQALVSNGASLPNLLIKHINLYKFYHFIGMANECIKVGLDDFNYLWVEDRNHEKNFVQLRDHQLKPFHSLSRLVRSNFAQVDLGKLDLLKILDCLDSSHHTELEIQMDTAHVAITADTVKWNYGYVDKSLLLLEYLKDSKKKFKVSFPHSKIIKSFICSGDWPQNYQISCRMHVPLDLGQVVIFEVLIMEAFAFQYILLPRNPSYHFTTSVGTTLMKTILQIFCEGCFNPDPLALLQVTKEEGVSIIMVNPRRTWVVSFVLEACFYKAVANKFIALDIFLNFVKGYPSDEKLHIFECEGIGLQLCSQSYSHWGGTTLTSIPTIERLTPIRLDYRGSLGDFEGFKIFLLDLPTSVAAAEFKLKVGQVRELTREWNGQPTLRGFSFYFPHVDFMKKLISISNDVSFAMARDKPQSMVLSFKVGATQKVELSFKATPRVPDFELSSFY